MNEGDIMSYFPMYRKLEQVPCLIIGGGKIAYQKVKVLSDFDADITVISPKIIDEIKTYKKVTFYEKQFEEADLDGKSLVVAATNQEEFNHKISELCHKRKIVVNAVDQIEDCDFIFPSYVKKHDVVAAVSSSGKSPVITQYIKGLMQELITEEIGELADFLGDLRPRIKKEIAIAENRKKIYQELLDMALENNTLPKEVEVERLIQLYR
jgi:precorrin-2 dehydrogenase/sirohydrochlorin ferrochelatase